MRSGRPEAASSQISRTEKLASAVRTGADAKIFQSRTWWTVAPFKVAHVPVGCIRVVEHSHKQGEGKIGALCRHTTLIRQRRDAVTLYLRGNSTGVNQCRR